MRRLIVVLIAVLLLVPVAPSAQQTRQQPGARRTIRRTVDLVLIDVRVTDRSGKPVLGLKPEQFTLTEDDRPQKISSFEYYNIEAIESAAAVQAKPIVVPVGSLAPTEKVRQEVRDHRLIVLFFDLTSLQPEELLRARAAAERYVREQMTPADLVAVIAFGNQLTVSAHFTNDREVLLRAVRALQPGKEAQLAGMAEAAAQIGEENVSEDTGAAFTPDETEFNIFNTDRKLVALESLAELLRGIPGRKAVIHFTGGITQTGEENRSQLRATTDAANRANASFYTVDARGLIPMDALGEARTGSAADGAMFTNRGIRSVHRASSKTVFGGAEVFNQIAARRASRETLATLASDTGGRSFFDLGDFGDVFQKVQADSGGYYLLGYYSSNPHLNGRWRRVKVRVNTGGARVRYREGYYAPRDYGQATAQDRERQLIEVMRSDAPRVEFPVALETTHFRLNHGQIFVPIAAKLPSSALEWAKKRGRREAEFDFAAEVRDLKTNKVVGALRDMIKVTLRSDQFQQAQQRAIVYQGGFVLGPGDYRLKFVARENESGRIGSFEQELALPAEQSDRLELSSVLLSSQLEPVRNAPEVTRKALGTDARLKTTPLEISGERMIPSVTRVFTTQQELYVFFQAYLPDKVDPSRMRAGLVFFRNGRWSSETPMVEPVEVDAKTQTASFRIGLPLGKLPAGDYTVHAIVVEDGGTRSAFARSFFALRRPTPAAPGVSPASPPVHP